MPRTGLLPYSAYYQASGQAAVSVPFQSSTWISHCLDMVTEPSVPKVEVRYLGDLPSADFVMLVASFYINFYFTKGQLTTQGTVADLLVATVGRSLKLFRDYAALVRLALIS